MSAWDSNQPNNETVAMIIINAGHEAIVDRQSSRTIQSGVKVESKQWQLFTVRLFLQLFLRTYPNYSCSTCTRTAVNVDL